MQHIHLNNIGSPFVPEHLISYLTGNFSEFTHHAPTLPSISSYAQKREFTQKKREILVDVLKKQYQTIGGTHTAVQKNITALLDPTTFTLTTGQQIHILGGPMFFMTKIMDIIALAKQMNETNDGKNYIPVFWMATEDHDLDEIKWVDVYGERFERETKETGGPVGRYSTDGLTKLIQEIRERLDDTPENNRYLDLREQAYTTFPNLAQATQRVLDQLFGDQGLIVLDADDTQLKALFAEEMRRELTEQASYVPLIEQTTLLEKTGLKAQAIPKKINLFYMTDTSRDRIDNNERKGEISFAQEAKTTPERFSPNVFFRTIYQESILPNLVYLAGPGEIKYWLQMKGMFEAYDLQMPVLLPRQMTQYLTEKNAGIIENSEIALADWFVGYDDFLELLKAENDEEKKELHGVLAEWQGSVNRLEKSMQGKPLDKNVAKSVKNIRSELATLERRLEQAEQAGLEGSNVYGKLLKIHKKSFDVNKRFERDQFVAGNVGLFEEMRNEWKFGEGVCIYIIKEKNGIL